MAKQAGLGDNLYVGGNDLSGDTGSIENIGGGPALLEIPGIDKSAMERVGGLRTGLIDWSSWFNDAPLAAHPVLSALPTADVVVSYFRGTTLGGRAAAMTAKQVNYDPTRAEDGSLSMSVQALSNGFGLEWGKSLTAGKESDTGAANGTGIDLDASTAFGLQAYLHVFSFAGTDATIKIQESSSDGGGDPYADVVGGGFAQVTTAPVTERIATATGLTVEQWLRAVTITSAGFTQMTFAIVVVKNVTVPVF